MGAEGNIKILQRFYVDICSRTNVNFWSNGKTTCRSDIKKNLIKGSQSFFNLAAPHIKPRTAIELSLPAFSMVAPSHHKDAFQKIHTVQEQNQKD